MKHFSLHTAITSLDTILKGFPDIQMTTPERRNLAIMCYSLPEKTDDFIEEAFSYFEQRKDVNWPDKVSYPILPVPVLAEPQRNGIPEASSEIAINAACFPATSGNKTNQVKVLGGEARESTSEVAAAVRSADSRGGQLTSVKL